MNIILGAISEGLIWSIMAIGIYISIRILQRPDLSAEGTFPLGAAVSSTLIVQGMNPLLATLIAMLAGMLGGLVTGFLSTKFRVPPLLAGVLTMTGLYSVNLRIMGRSNVSLLNQPRLTSFFNQFLNIREPYDRILLAVIVIAIVIFLVYHYLKTDNGQALIATGDNEKMARSMGISTNTMRVLGLMISNGLIALSGSLISQANGYADISMGIGTFVIGLAAIIIAETLYRSLPMLGRLISLPVGAILYRLIIAFVLEMGMQPNDLKLISALTLAIFIGLPAFIQEFREKQAETTE